MKISLSDLLIPAIAIGVGGWWGYSTWSAHVEKSHTEQAHLEATAREDRALDEIAHRYEAKRALTAGLSTEAGAVFTYQVQNALSASTGKAVIITGRLTDIEKRDGLYLLHLDDTNASSVFIRYVLECDLKHAEPLIAKRTEINTITAVVLVASVEKAEFKLYAGKGGDKEPNPARDEGAPFIARGRCLEIVVR